MRRESFHISPEKGPDGLSPAEGKAFDLLKIEHDELAIDIDEFKKVTGYGKERVERDKGKVRRKKAGIRERDTGPSKKARLLEMIFTNQIELSNWFGQDTYTIIPTEYDDMFHGVDLALEREEDEEVRHLALGIDVTSSPPCNKKEA